MTTKSPSSGDVTALLEAWNQGDRNAFAQLMEVVKKELRDLAGAVFHSERVGHTLQPTAIVNEVFLRFTGQRQVRWKNRVEFFRVSAKIMRRILVDHARRHRAEKRGGGAVHLSLDDALGVSDELAPEVLALDDALIDLARRSPRQARIVEMRVIVGLTLEEIASVEDISLSTVSRDWKAARLFLLSQLHMG